MSKNPTNNHPNPSEEHLILSDFPKRPPLLPSPLSHSHSHSKDKESISLSFSPSGRSKSSDSTSTYASKSPLHTSASMAHSSSGAKETSIPMGSVPMPMPHPRFANEVEEKKGRHESILIEKGWNVNDVSPSLDRVTAHGMGGNASGNGRDRDRGHRPRPSYFQSDTLGTGDFQAGAPKLEFAEGDYLPNNKLARWWLALLNSSMLIRWTIYIIPIAGLLWIPGIIGLTIAPDATIFSIPLLWASIYFSVIWVGWFVSLLIGLTIPTFLRITLGSIAPELKHYIAYLNALPRYIALSLWSLSNWIVFIAVIRKKGDRDNSTRDGSALFKFQQFVFAFFIDAVLLFVIKLLVQMIAYNFHRKSYEDRIAASKAQIRSLVRLYVHSRDVSNVAPEVGKMDSIRALKKALKEVKRVAQTTTTMLGTVASELAGERILQPNSPGSVVTNALSSTNKTRQLARRIFYSFVPAYRNHLLLEDIKGVFDTEEQAEFAFAQFDRDENGDASLEEVELACLDIHRERLALASSMRDLDSAVARLNSILVSVYSVVAIIIVLGVMNIGFNNLLVSAGTLILGLSWLIGSTAQEILSSIIFLFIKHPYDVSDRVDLDGVAYVVKEMSLLSTVFRQTDGKLVQIPHSVLNTKAVSNIRRSGPISETFVWNVEFGTSFEQIEKLREKMLEFLVAEKRDFLPVMDISIQNFEDQGKMTLGSDIKYKSNWQNGALKAQRRNKWICALKLTMASLKIYGPGGAGNPSPEAAATRVHLLQEDPAGPMAAPPRMPTPKFYPAKEASYSFADKREIFTDPSGDVFDEVERSSPPQPHVVSQQTAAGRVQEGTQRREFRSQ